MEEPFFLFHKCEALHVLQQADLKNWNVSSHIFIVIPHSFSYKRGQKTCILTCLTVLDVLT